MKSRFFIVLAVLAVTAITLQGCSADKKPPLKGERVAVMQFEGTTQADKDAQNTQVALVAEKDNTAWPQAGGNAEHLPQNLSLNHDALKQIWETDIGSGSADDRKLISSPIAAENHIFIADTKGHLSAYLLDSGKKLWTVKILKNSDSTTVSAGLAYNNGVIYATDGVHQVVALNASDGKQIWSQSVNQPVRGAPTVQNGRLYFITLSDETYALDTKNGETLWHHQGVQESADLLGAPSPAVEGSVVITAYSSGDVTALRSETGQEAWTDNMTGVSEYQSRTVTQLAGFRGSPVLEQDVAYVGNSSSRFVAEHVPSGDRIWQKEFGVMGTPWISGNIVFAVTSQNEVVALIKENGQAKWVAPLPRYEDPADKDDPIFWSGPVLAGNRLFVTGSNGRMLEIDPATGKTIRQTKLSHAIMIPPIVVQKTLVVVMDNGKMVAYR